MNIILDIDRPTSRGDVGVISQSKPSSTQIQDTGKYTLDISDIVMDNSAYKGQGKTIEDVMQNAQNLDLAVQRDYMTVMSNSMSTEDFQKLREEGFPIGTTDAEKIVTVVDQIKAKFVEADIQIEGYTDSLSSKDIKDIIGNESRAIAIASKLNEKDIPDTNENVTEVTDALEETLKLTKLTDSSKKYMIENRKEPTIENIYKAQFSSSGQQTRQGSGYYKDSEQGHYAKKADSIQWTQLESQINKVCKDTKLIDKEVAYREGKWLIENGIPLTKENLQSAYDLSQMKLPQKSNEIVDAIINSMVSGKRAKQTNLFSQRNVVKEAIITKENINKITINGIQKAIEQNKSITIENLMIASRKVEADRNLTLPLAQNRNYDDEGKRLIKHNNHQINSNDVLSSLEVDDLSKENNSQINSKDVDSNQKTDVTLQENQIKEITARRQLEEIRLKMSVEANIKLFKKGFSINTVALEKVIEALKNVEMETKKVLFGDNHNSTILEKEVLFQETKEKVGQIAELPATVLGKVITLGYPTLNEIHYQGKLLERTYKEASQTYEALMTAPRKDLGDSLKKAFRNIDDILEDMDLEVKENNQRAVRILSYNHMSINQENIEAVKEADLALQDIINKLTPARTLQLIREGINPLEINLNSLEKQLDTMNIADENPAEKYAKFLQELEQNKAIEPEEKEAYIGIYRLLRQVEKADGAAIGRLVSQGSELSFKNLLSAVRSKKKEGIDYQLDEKFAGIDESKVRGNKISEQISNYYNRLANKLADKVTKNIGPNEKQMEQYVAEDKAKVQEVQKVEDYVIQTLLDAKLPVTIDYLLATKSFSNERDTIFKKMKKLAAEESLLESFQEATDNIEENFNSKEEVGSAYDNLQETMSKVMDSTIIKGNRSVIDMKEISILYKQISFATKKAKEENYEVPITVNGEITAINLRVIHGKEDVGKVVATMMTKEYGQVAAELSIDKGNVKGYIVSDSEKGLEPLKGLLETFKDNLGKEGREVGDLIFITSKTLNIQNFMQKISSEENKVSTKELYQVAKAFIAAVHEMK